jgi:predicted DNA binding CopG/RHH family protein
MRRIRLTPYEKRIEKDLIEGNYTLGSKEEVEEMRAAIEAYRKNAVLHIRINEAVLQKLKDKAKKLGVKYQTFIAEILRKVAHS